jgi:hypothetical protein
MPHETTISIQQSLLLSVLQQMREQAGNGICVSLTSANPGEGVTTSVVSLVEALQRDPVTRTLEIDAPALRRLAVEPSDIVQSVVPTNADGVFVFNPVPSHNPGLWEGNLQYRKECMDVLCRSFTYIIVDCPSLATHGDALTLAPVVDGTVLVVESGRTTKDQLLRAERSIEFAGGKLIGSILNKRTYPVPEWLYSKL